MIVPVHLNHAQPHHVVQDMRLHRIRLVAAGLIAFAPFVLAGCGSDDAADPGTSGTTSTSAESETGATTGSDDGEAGGMTITIKDFAYGDPLTVAPGTEVTVVNEDSAPHNANDAGGAWEFDLLQQGESTTFTAPTDTGTYDLICTQHPDMAGELIVAG